MALIWIIDYSVISAIWTRIWHPSFRYEIPEKDGLIFFIKMAQKIITDLFNLSTNNVFMCIHSMTFLSSLNIWTGINMHAKAYLFIIYLIWACYPQKGVFLLFAYFKSNKNSKKISYFLFLLTYILIPISSPTKNYIRRVTVQYCKN
jgi:hypothetical protein